MKSLLIFLRKYSDVDVDFIEDFIKIREGDKTHDPFRSDVDVDFIEDFIKIREGDKTHDPFRIDLDIMTNG